MTAAEFFTQLVIPVPGDAKHGRYATFRDDECRCLPCCNAFSAFRDSGPDNAAAGDGIKHGLTAYVNRGCRCDECTAAQREYYRDYERRRKAKAASE